MVVFEYVTLNEKLCVNKCKGFKCPVSNGILKDDDELYYWQLLHEINKLIH